MPATWCCVPRCSNRGGHVFPSRLDVRKRWIIAIKRSDGNRVWHPKPTSVVCKAHFTCEDYISETSLGTQPQRQKLKKDAVPSVFDWSKPVKCRRPIIRQAPKPDNAVISVMPPDMEIGAEEETETVAPVTVAPVHQPQHAATQTDQAGIIETRDCGTGSVNFPLFSAKLFSAANKAIHFYTGLECYVKFQFVLQTLGLAAYNLNYIYGAIHQISVEDQFFLVLIKLRLHQTNYELSTLFNISEADVYNLCCTWIRFISLQWREVSVWPSQDMVRFYSPSGFKSRYPSTRVIVDGTECPVKKPKLPTAQQSTYSTYKNRNTTKVLVGISPGGLVSYVSDAYGGSTSDRQIVERSNLPQKCDSGDSVMADKGFNVQDIFAPCNVTVNIPTFFNKRNRMSGDKVMRDRKIASKRVHVERIIGLGKTYKILVQPMNTWETQLSSDIIFICFMLCNFRAGIIPKHA